MVAGYFYFKVDDEILREVEQRFATHYQHLVVDVGSVRREQGKGIYVGNLVLAEPRAGGRPQPVLSIDELFLACDAGIGQLMSGKLDVRQIIVRRPRLRAVLQPDGRWNVASLVPPPKFSDDTPEMLIEDATLILEDATRHAVAPLSFRGIDLKLIPGEPASTGGSKQARSLTLTGAANGAPARSIGIQGTLSPADGTFNLTAEVHGLEITPELIAAIPFSLPNQFHAFEFYASADGTVSVARSAPATVPLVWSANVALTRGRLGHASLPQPITEITAAIEADSSKLVVKQFTGRLGAADFVIACNRQGWASTAPLALSGRVVGLAVNADLEAALPARLEKLWQRFRPRGIVDADVEATFDGHEWRPDLTAHCRGLSLTDAEKFPYPVEGATGTVSLNRSPATGMTQLELDLVGIGNGRPIHIAAKLDRLAMPRIPVAGGSAAVAFADSPSPANGVVPAAATSAVPLPSKPTGWVEVSGSGVALHEQLFAALPGKAQPFVRSLHPQGLIDFRWRYERLDPAAPRGDTSLELQLADCAIKYERFPYPLEQVRGRVSARNNHYVLSDVVGRDRQGAAAVTCRGDATVGEAGLDFDLTFHGGNVPLDENLKQALSPPVQQVWTDLRPQGRINFLAEVKRRAGDVKPAIRVQLSPYEQTVSVDPVCFPYRFEQVGGTATVTDGRVDLAQLKGIHGQSLYTASGLWLAAPGGGWQLTLNNLNADRVTFDTDFLRAVPPGVQRVIDRIRPTGNFNAYNSTFRFIRTPASPKAACQWDLQLACHQSALRGDLPLDNFTGGVRLMGSSDDASVSSYGELAIESLIWNDIQFTNIHGPFWTDSTVCYLGQQATAKLAQPPRRITADVFGGTIAADTVLQHAGQPRYNTEISIGGVDLGRFARERMGGPGDLKGSVSGVLSLNGTGRSTYALSGRGELHVVDANIYQLPPLVAMLKVLRNRTPDSTAFDRCDMKFDIYGENIHFNQLNLLGDAVSLYGRGQTNFDRRLDLTFYTLVGRVNLPILSHVSEQGLQIKVDGTWDNPVPHREAFPMVNQMLDQIRTEAEQGAAAVAPPAAAGIPWVGTPR